VTITADFEEFVTVHREHGRLTSDVGALTPNGHRLRSCTHAVSRSIGGSCPRTESSS
jgi:hypothetical protein